MSTKDSMRRDFWKKVEHPQRITQVWNTMSRLYGVSAPRANFWNPGPRPTPLNKTALREIATEPYLVAEKSDGLRMHLLLGRYSDNTPFSVMIDNRGNVYELIVYAARVYFDGSLFDGELVVRRGVNRWYFLVFDVVTLSGTTYVNENLITRYQIVQRVFTSQANDDGLDDQDRITDSLNDTNNTDEESFPYENHRQPHQAAGDSTRNSCTSKLHRMASFGSIVSASEVQQRPQRHEAAVDTATARTGNLTNSAATADGRIAPTKATFMPVQTIRFFSKNMFPFSNFGTLVRISQSIPYETDGFIWTPINAGIQVGTHATCFKWKYDPSIDIRIIAHPNNPDHVDIFVDDHGKEIHIKDAMPKQQFRFQITGQCALLPGQPVIVEAIVRKDTGTTNSYSLMYHRLRADRMAPNSVGTLRAVIKEVDEGITIDELLAIASTAKI